jgi:hypothetical protein
LPAKKFACLAVLLFGLLPSTASASHSAYLDAVSPTVAGCQVKGLFGIPAPSGSGALPASVYIYIVTAVTATGEVAPSCPPQTIPVNGTASQNSALIQWNQTPGAVGYKIYRGTINPATGAVLTPPQALIFAAGPVTTLPKTSVCPPSGNGPRCFFQDNGGSNASGLFPPAGAAAAPQAGGHPDLQITQRVDYGGTDPNSPATNTTDDPYPNDPNTSPAALKSDFISFPPGLVANPRATGVCPLEGPNSLLGDPNKFGSDDVDEDKCPRSTLVGTVQSLTRTPSGLSPTQGDIYNGETKAGEPARLFIVLRPLCSAGSPVAPGSATCSAVLGASTPPRQVEKQFLAAVSTINARTDGTYGIDVHVVEAEDDSDLSPTLAVLVPNPAAANALVRGGTIPIQVRQITQRLFGYADQGTADPADDVPFVTLPTSCGVKTMTTSKTTHADPVAAGGSATFTTTGCDSVPFDATTEATSDTSQAEYPVGFGNSSVLGGNDDPIHQSHIRKITATFPPGLVLSSSSGAVIQAIGAQLGTVTGFSDELGDLTGTLTLQSVGTDAAGHFNGSFVVRATVKDTKPGTSTVLVLDGTTTADQATGQLKAVFDNLPEVPFKRLELKFNGGPNAPLVNPPTCGANTVRQDIEPWSGTAAVAATTTYTTTFDGVAGACPSKRGFAPTLGATASPLTAGAFTALTTNINRGDREQALAGFTLDLPKGMLAKLGTIPFCPSASADLGTCAASSKVGSVQIAAGTGPSPVSLPGTISLAEPVPGSGDVASLVVAIPVKVGPFDVGTVVSRARLQILFDPEVGVRVTTTAKLPTIAGGIPVRVRSLELKIDAPGFQRNPTSCARKDFVATFTSQGDPTTPTTAAEGGATNTSTAPFQATDCDKLPFAPKVAGTVDATGQSAKGSHPALTVTVSQNDDESATRSARVTLPNTLTANLAGLATPCTEAQLAAAQCPAGATVGDASATSPLIPVPLSGPIVAIEQTGDLPKLAVLLNGPLNVRLDATILLDTTTRAGQTLIVNSFPSIPDVPLSRFTLKLKGGATGLLTNAVSLCSGAGDLVGTFTGHNGKTADVSSPLLLAGLSTKCAPAAPSTDGVLFGVKRGRADLSLEISREGAKAADRIKSVRLTLPKGVSVNKSGAKRRLDVVGGGKKLARKTTKTTSKRVTVSGLGTGKSTLRLHFRPGSLKLSKAVRRKGKSQTLSFKLHIVDRSNRVYNVTVKLKPRS